METRDGQPVKLGGQRVSFILDRYRICPEWGRGYKPRNYFLVDVEGKTLCIYQAGEDWFLDSVVD